MSGGWIYLSLSLKVVFWAVLIDLVLGVAAGLALARL
jgi:ABC-type molybdate transport system permease subunit